MRVQWSKERREDYVASSFIPTPTHPARTTHKPDLCRTSRLLAGDALVLDEMFGASFHPDIDVFIIIFNVELTSILHANLNLIDLHVPY